MYEQTLCQMNKNEKKSLMFCFDKNHSQSIEIIIRTFVAKVLREYLNLLLAIFHTKEIFQMEIELINTVFAIYIRIDLMLKCLVAIFVCSMSSTFAPLKRFNQAVCPSLNP